MLSDRLKKRLVKDHSITSNTLRIPVDVADLLKEIAPLKGVLTYHTLLKAYISYGLWQDEAKFSSNQAARETVGV